MAAAVSLWQIKPWVAEADDRSVFASGTVDATEISVSFRVPGILHSRPVNEGSVVKAGDLLAELDAREARARLRQAHAAGNADDDDGHDEIKALIARRRVAFVNGTRARLASGVPAI